MSLMKRATRDKTPKSILKQPRIQEEPQITREVELEQEARFWRSRFEDLTAKRQKQKKSTLRESIWDQDQRETDMFKQLEQQVIGSYPEIHKHANSEKKSRENHHLSRIDIANSNTCGKGNSTRESSLDNCSENEHKDQKNNQDKQSNEVRKIESEQRELTGLIDLHKHKDANEELTELQSEVLALMQELGEWKSKYEDAVDPRRMQQMQDSLLQEFLEKMQLGIEEVKKKENFIKAAEQFEEDKKSYMHSKDREVEGIQHHMEELSLIVSQKDSMILAKEFQIAELELEIKDKDKALYNMKKEKDLLEEQQKNISTELEKLKENEIKQLRENERITNALDKTTKDAQNIRSQYDELNIKMQQQLKDNELLVSKSAGFAKEVEILNNKIIQMNKEKEQLSLSFSESKEKVQEQQLKLVKQREEIECQEELREQLEEHRNKEQLLDIELQQLKNDYSQLQQKYNLYDQVVHQKGFEVQQLIKQLQQEMQSYAEEVELAHQAEVSYQKQIQQLEDLLQREKQLSSILQDTILAQKAVQQSQQQQQFLPQSQQILHQKVESNQQQQQQQQQ